MTWKTVENIFCNLLLILKNDGKFNWYLWWKSEQRLQCCINLAHLQGLKLRIFNFASKKSQDQCFDDLHSWKRRHLLVRKSWKRTFWGIDFVAEVVLCCSNHSNPFKGFETLKANTISGISYFSKKTIIFYCYLPRNPGSSQTAPKTIIVLLSSSQ